MGDPGMAQRLEEAAATLEEFSGYEGFPSPSMTSWSAIGLRRQAAYMRLESGLSVVEVEGMSKDG